MKMKTKLTIQLSVIRSIILLTALYIFMMVTSFSTITPDILSVSNSSWLTKEGLKTMLLLTIFGVMFLSYVFINFKMSKRAERLRKILKVEKCFLRI